MTNTVSKTVSDETLDSIIQIESSGNPKAKATTSSALGLGQFLNATWLKVVKDHAPGVFQGRTQSQVLVLRTDPSFSIEMLARFTEDNLRAVGAGATPGDLYLAHFLGVGDARSVYRASASTPVSVLVSPAAIKANPSILRGKTAGQVRAWADRKMQTSGGHGWVKKYYRPGTRPEAQAAPVGVADFAGDEELLEVQTQLKTMNYYAGDLDGLWGSKTSGAISGFLNDWNGQIPAPTSLNQYKRMESEIRAQIDDAEDHSFTRPVTPERREADPKTVAKLAPEIVPTKHNFLVSLWASILAFAAAAWDTLAGLAQQGWQFFSANKDSIPGDATSFVSKVPVGVWIFLIAAILAYVALNARKSMAKIQDDVSSGVR